MFGMGMGEILLIAVVALLFLGPEKLPDAAKTLSKGIRDFRKQTRELQQIVEDDSEIGGAIRDIKSALRGEDPEIAERRRKAVAAARKAAENAAKAADELAQKRAAEEAAKDGAGDAPVDAVSAPAGADVDSAPAGALIGDGEDDDRDVATMLGMSGDEPAGGPAPGPDDAVSDNPGHSDGHSDGQNDGDTGAQGADDAPLYRPAAGALAYQPRPLFANGQPGDGQPDESDTDDASADAEDAT